MSISENANKTAQWWADQLKSSSVKLDNGSADAGLLAVLAFCGPKSNDYTDEQINIFRSHLVKHIEAEIEECGDCLISVGYSPDRVLEESADLAGILLGVQDLPWQTWTRTSQEGVCLSHGYGANQVDL